MPVAEKLQTVFPFRRKRNTLQHQIPIYNSSSTGKIKLGFYLKEGLSLPAVAENHVCGDRLLGDAGAGAGDRQRLVPYRVPVFDHEGVQPRLERHPAALLDGGVDAVGVDYF